LNKTKERRAVTYDALGRKQTGFVSNGRELLLPFRPTALRSAFS
jgi:hypothetical protein